MAYCTSAQVASEFKGIDFGAAGSKVSSAEVDEFIAEEELRIDSYLSKRYEVPISQATSPKAFIFVRGICRRLVSARVASIIKVKAKSDDAEKDSKNNGSSSIWKNLRDIAEGKADLPSDATFKKASTTKRFHVEQGEKNVFDMEKDNW